jgi:phosphopantetheinyl transferase (holo-ACP synthase)
MKITHEVQISAEKDAFTNSREALARLLQNEAEIKIGDLKTDLELVNYQNLKNFPDFVLSLSHTKGAGAAVLASKSEVSSLGIDIEWSDRSLKDEAARFYKNEQDSVYENKIELWTMKEAAFKALSPLGFPGVLVLSKIIIQDGQFFTNERPEIIGVVKTHLKNVDNKKLWVAIAYTTLK